MDHDYYELGDIVRWRSPLQDTVDYGMVIKAPEIVSAGIYTFTNQIVQIMEIEDDTFRLSEPLMALTIYSFGEQKVMTLYKNPEDVPLFIEKVTFSEKSPWQKTPHGV